VPLVSVVCPCFDQEPFLPSAVASLRAQALTDWELVVVDDGSPGDVAAALGDALDDPRVRLVRHPGNRGLGAALNRGLDETTAPLVAYLPADDLLHRGHLAALVAALGDDDVLAVTGVRHHERQEALGAIEGEPLQLVQVLHRRTGDRWLERGELTTDDLGRMLWDRLRARGPVAVTGRVTCEWVDHPAQRHKVMREPTGGLNAYRSRYRVREPLRFHSTVGSPHDEVEHYRADRERPATPRAPDGLRVLLVGELAHNPERVLALERRGHELHGLWTDIPVWFNAVGPLPFGHVADVPREGWREAVRELRPDVVYALLNWEAVPIAHEVLTAGLDVPVVWHIKEGPTFSRVRGHWPQLAELHTRADGLVYSSAELRDWFGAMLPVSARRPSMVLDGDLPRDLVPGEPPRRLSEDDGQLHTVIAGRPLGPDPELAAELAAHGVHIHVHGQKVQSQMRDWVEAVQRAAPGHLHLHPQVDRDDWVRVLGRYDAGWLHCFRSANEGDLLAATWDDLNIPARVATLALAGVPSIQRDNAGSVVATQTQARQLGLGVLFRDAEDLAAQLRDEAGMAALRRSTWAAREQFTFEAHADRLVAFLRAAAG
jgi:hypothetical protein